MGRRTIYTSDESEEETKAWVDDHEAKWRFSNGRWSSIAEHQAYKGERRYVINGNCYVATVWGSPYEGARYHWRIEDLPVALQGELWESILFNQEKT